MGKDQLDQWIFDGVLVAFDAAMPTVDDALEMIQEPYRSVASLGTLVAA